VFTHNAVPELDCNVDISTLSRMTGKDFSGPTPIIRMPTPIALPELSEKDDLPSGAVVKSAPTPKPKRKKSKTPALAPDEEIVGAADTFLDEED
jgi:transcription factor TFIIIB component B''